jgi:hypothetical protein
METGLEEQPGRLAHELPYGQARGLPLQDVGIRLSIVERRNQEDYVR